ncbi:MAG: 30S ribosomal protein S17 [Candidatus Pacebacteria bacterium]|nr:30S ribosomal protein S17 [Candidatus Paceibacterota bacterium]
MEKEQVKNKKTLSGTVVSDKMDKTAVVLIDRYVKYPIKYGKFRKISKKIKAHDETNECKMGDKVTIEEAVPMSKGKAFKVKKVIK